MPGDAATTRRRILDAAVTEFSAHGVAGARVDRIAALAGSNKAMIYAYFGSKSALFDAVFDEMVVRTLDAVPIDPDDLPEYAGLLYDQHRAHVAPLRVGSWDWLEREGQGAASAAVQAALTTKEQAVADAQRRGVVRDDLPAGTLLTLVLALSRTGVWDPAAVDPATHRVAVVQAVARLVSPGFR